MPTTFRVKDSCRFLPSLKQSTLHTIEQCHLKGGEMLPQTLQVIPNGRQGPGTVVAGATGRGRLHYMDPETKLNSIVSRRETGQV